jgi:hypothetical protein
MKEKILELRNSGKTYDEICHILNCAKSTVAWHCSEKIRVKSYAYRLKNKRQSIIDLKQKYGGKCSLCGYNRCLTSLHFHHLDPSEKEAKVAVLLNNGSKKQALAEAKKCILVCSNCHGEIEEKKRGTYVGHQFVLSDK